MINDPVLQAIDSTVNALLKRSTAHWIIAFSGGKDSSAALKIFFSAYKLAQIKIDRITIIYCDTGVENPVLDFYVKSVLTKMRYEFENEGINFEIKLLKAPPEDRFFVRLIGRGYPPPTNSFRWCTTGLRIRPVSRYIASQNPKDTVVILGLRRAESQQRDRSMARSPEPQWQKQREGRGEYDLFLPILNLNVSEVWDAVFALSRPRSIIPQSLETLYRDASGECPVIKAPQAPPCASGRFGCWTCTVVRKDKSAAELINSGYPELLPYFTFRNWLTEIRNDPARRWPRRRSGAEGMGPLTLEARKEILHRVDELEERTRALIIDSDERGLIASLWRIDHMPRIYYPSQKLNPQAQN